MLAMLCTSTLGFLVTPPAGVALAPVLRPALHTIAAVAPLPSASDELVSLSTTGLIANADGFWLNADFDSLAALAIPFFLAGLLFVFFKLAKLFASQF